MRSCGIPVKATKQNIALMLFVSLQFSRFDLRRSGLKGLDVVNYYM